MVPWNGLDVDGLGGAALPAIDMARLNIEEIPPTPPELEGGAEVSCTVDCLCRKNTIVIKGFSIHMIMFLQPFGVHIVLIRLGVIFHVTSHYDFSKLQVKI